MRAGPFLLAFALALATAFVIHWFPRLGIPLQSDVTWIFRLQVSTLDPEAIPYGLAAFSGRPDGPMTSCVRWYEAFGRWNCIDILAMRGIASVANGSADLWRGAFIVLGSATVAIFVLLGRRLGAPFALVAFLAVGLLLSPIEVWGEYTAAEVKAAPFVLVAMLLALRSRGIATQAASAAAMVAAVFAKETSLVVWPAILGAAMIAPTTSRGRPSIGWWFLSPHGAAFAALGVFVLWLRIHPPATDYALYRNGPFLPAYDFIRAYLSALQPGLLRGNVVLPILGVIALATIAVRARGGQIHSELLARMPLFIGIAVALVLHALVYYSTNRFIGDGRYLLPANYLLSAAIAALGAAIVRSLPEGRRAFAMVLLAAMIALGFLIQHRSLDGLALVALPIGALIAVVGLAMARKATPSARAWVALAATMPLVLIGPIDAGLHDAGRARVDQLAWRSLQDRVIAEAPRDGHVVLVIDEVHALELLWGLETETLLRGREDLTYHLTVIDPEFSPSDGGLLATIVEAMNRDRRAIPSPTEGRVLEIRADRRGRSDWVAARPRGPAAIRDLITDPLGAFGRRYVAGKPPFLRFEITLR